MRMFTLHMSYAVIYLRSLINSTQMFVWWKSNVSLLNNSTLHLSVEFFSGKKKDFYITWADCWAMKPRDGSFVYLAVNEWQLPALKWGWKKSAFTRPMCKCKNVTKMSVLKKAPHLIKGYRQFSRWKKNTCSKNVLCFKIDLAKILIDPAADYCG